MLLCYMQLLLLVKVTGMSISQFVRGHTNLQQMDKVLLVSDHVVPFPEQTIRSPILCGYKPIHIRNPELLHKGVAKGRALLFSRTEYDHGLGEVLAMRSSYSLAPPLLYHHLIPRDR